MSEKMGRNILSTEVLYLIGIEIKNLTRYFFILS